MGKIEEELVKLTNATTDFLTVSKGSLEAAFKAGDAAVKTEMLQKISEEIEKLKTLYVKVGDFEKYISDNDRVRTWSSTLTCERAASDVYEFLLFDPGGSFPGAPWVKRVPFSALKKEDTWDPLDQMGPVVSIKYSKRKRYFTFSLGNLSINPDLSQEPVMIFAQDRPTGEQPQLYFAQRFSISFISATRCPFTQPKSKVNLLMLYGSQEYILKPTQAIGYVRIEDYKTAQSKITFDIYLDRIVDVMTTKQKAEKRAETGALFSEVLGAIEVSELLDFV